MIFDLEKYAAKAREVMGEGAVLLRNDSDALPLAKGSKAALFGRAQYNYYKSGTGSGGMVNTRYVTGVKEAIEQSGVYEMNPQVKAAYDAWIAEHPYNQGEGWAAEPWFQEEMPLSEELVKAAAAESDAAIIIIGRTAGEDQDNKAEAGSYYLTDAEKDMLEKVCRNFSRSIVLINAGNIIDMNWVEEYDPSAVMYIWQGGQEGGNGVLDVLDGDVNPSGKLPDTIPYAIEDCPAYANFGSESKNIYAEDIYVGYRYFETFAKDKVQYPFGYGLSYTTFSVENSEEPEAIEFAPDQKITLSAKVTNTGKTAGKEVVQAYVSAPQGALGRPAVSLTGYAKTKLLAPGESQTVTISFDPYVFAAYDDAGVTGYRSAYVLEAGDYEFLLGCDCRELIQAASLNLPETIVIDQLEEALAPVEAFDRMKAQKKEDGSYEVTWEKTPLRTVSMKERRLARLPEDLPYTGDMGYKLWDVADGKVSMETFLAQLSNEDFGDIICGEGMNSPKVTPGTGGSYGGMTERLVSFGIPTACCSDGPSGIRMDCGSIAFAMPNGTCMAASFNDALIEEIYEWEGLELRKNRIEALLGPGMNLHRYPLNGRNFEYFSEDPLLTGKMAAAQLRGMKKKGVTGTIKHFAGNEQEFHRHQVNSVVSERALRELYLKGFEIAVKEGGTRAIMTSYNPVNGTWTSCNYDLLTTILRGEWGYDGFVMTDWWANTNDPENEGEEAPARDNTGAMVRGQNDVYMVVAKAAGSPQEKNLVKAIEEGKTTRGEAARNAANICRACIGTAAYYRLKGEEQEIDRLLTEESNASDSFFSENVIKIPLVTEAEIPADSILTGKGDTTAFQILNTYPSANALEFEARVVTDNAVAQVNLSVFQDRTLLPMISMTGADKEWKKFHLDLSPVLFPNFFLRFYFSLGGMELRNVRVFMTRDLTEVLKKFQS